MQSECSSGRRQQNRKQKMRATDDSSETSSSPVEVDQQCEANTTSGNNGTECRRSSRKKTIKFDVRDLLNKNRKSHKIQIEARIDSNAPKLGAGQPSKEEINSKQKTFNEKSEIFRRYSISENRGPPRLPPSAALIQKIQQCVGELEQLPLDGEIDLATISPIARRLSRTQEILTASMMKPKQVNSLIVTKLESTSSPKASPAGRGKGGRPKMPPKSPDAETSILKTQKRRGRPPKTKLVESSGAASESSCDSPETVEASKPDELDLQPSSNKHEQIRSEEHFVNGREFSISPDSSTKGIDLREMLDASAVTLPQPTILDDCMLVSNDDLFVAAEEEVFTQVISSDESTVHSNSSPKENGSDEVSLFARSDSTETSNSDDSERRRKKVRVSVRRVLLPPTIRERMESNSRSSDEKSDIIEISSNDGESIRDDATYEETIKKIHESQLIEEDQSELKVKPKRMSPRKSIVPSPIESTVSNINSPLIDDNSNSNIVGSIVEISSESTTPIEELLTLKASTKSSRLKSTRRHIAMKKLKDNKVSEETKGSEECVLNEALHANKSSDSNKQEKPSTSEELPKPILERLRDQSPQKIEQNKSHESDEMSPRSRKQGKEKCRTDNAITELKFQEKTVPATRSQMSMVPNETSNPQSEGIDYQNEQNTKNTEPVLTESLPVEEHTEMPQNPTIIQEEPAHTKQAEIVTPRRRRKHNEDCQQGDPIDQTKPTRKILRSARTEDPTPPIVLNTRESLRKTNKSVSNSDTETSTSSRHEPTLRSKASTDIATSTSTHPSPPLKSPEGQDHQKTKPKGRQKSKKDNFVGDQEETNSVHSESSLTSSSSCSIVSTSSSPAPSNSSSQVRASRSRTLQLSLENKLSNSSIETTEVKPPTHIAAERALKREEEQFTEPDSESSENSNRKNVQALKSEKGASLWYKERVKLVQRRKSARLSRWANFGEEGSEASSESSETYLPARKLRLERNEVACVEEDPTSSNKLESNVRDGDETISPVTSETDKPTETVNKDLIEPKTNDNTNCANDQPSAEPPPSDETLSIDRSREEEKYSDRSEQLSEESENLSEPSNKPRSRRATRKFTQLKCNSLDATESPDNRDTVALSDAEMPSPSSRNLRHTRARRKTISSAKEIQTLIPSNLSPPDKAIEYKTKVKLCKSVDEAEKIQCKRLSDSEEHAVNDSLDSLIKVPEHAEEEYVSKVDTELGDKEPAETDETDAKLETTTVQGPDNTKSNIDSEQRDEEHHVESTAATVNDTGEVDEKSKKQENEDNTALDDTTNDVNTPESKPHVHRDDETREATIPNDPTNVVDTHPSQPVTTELVETNVQEQIVEFSAILPAEREADSEKLTNSSSFESRGEARSNEEAKKPKEIDSTITSAADISDPELIKQVCADIPKDFTDPPPDCVIEAKVEQEINPSVEKLDTKTEDITPICDSHSDSFTKPEQTSGIDTSSLPEPEATADSPSEKPQHKKDTSPSKKKKHLSKIPETPKTNGDENRKGTSQKKTKPPNEENKESTTKSSLIPNQSEDTSKTEIIKSEQKPLPHRQLDSSFIKSLEKSLLSTKKILKKKEKDSSTKSTPKDKEESRKSKKNQEHQKEEKKSETSSPKPRKKHKESSKSEKKCDDDGTKAKRKNLKKAKEADLDQPDEIPATQAQEVSIIKTHPVITEAPVASVIPKPEPTVVTHKTVKSKGETKFYPNETPVLEKPLIVIELSGTPKEKSPPDSIPNPLKDIEKFIEDGENLLKRGYKLEDDEIEVQPGRDREIVKTDDVTTIKKSKVDDGTDEKKTTSPEDDNSNSNSESSMLATTPTSETDTPNGIRRSHRIKNNSKSTKCLVGRGLVRDKERFSMKDDEKTIYSIDDQKMDLAEVEAKNSKFLKDMEESLSNFRVIKENEYKCERVISKEAKRMLCDCFLTPEEEERGELGCGEDCLNRLLMIECGSDCTVRDRCTNRRFVKFLYSPCRVFRTEKKGFGIMADIEILPGEFIMEYVGEVINGDEFEHRRNAYSEEKNKHYYFMALRSDAIIDATAKGNISRFINHSCDPNAETQKWTVNGELRIGFFSKKNIMPGEEITFDYQYQRYGKEAQKCFCESVNCRGWIGAEPSSEEEEEYELDEDDEGESEDLEEDEDRSLTSPTVPTSIPAPIPTNEDSATIPPAIITDVDAAVNKDALIQTIPHPTPTAAEATAKSIKDLSVKKKKEKKRLIREKDEKIKRREAKQFLEDPDIEDEVRFLSKCGLRNQADTLRLSRLMVRAKLLQTRLKLLQILRNGELPCRRLFLDYHGLRLLHGWMSEVIDSQETEKGMDIRMALLSVLECLPISNKTLLTDSKVYQTVRDWSNNKETRSPNDESPKDSAASGVADPEKPSSSALCELQKLAAKLVNTWDNLPEVFRIPKRERIEQMKEHEREADRQYKALGEDLKSVEDRNRERFMKNSVAKGSRFKWSRSDKERNERERAGDRRRYASSSGSLKDGSEKLSGALPGDPQLSKEQRRELFAAKVARDEAEKRLAEERREFEVKCRFFGLDPKRMRPENMPFCVNPSTGQWYSTNKKPIITPPSYAHVQVPVKPKSTDPNDYRLPQMDLPPFWKFAISPKGKIYYYHVKIRIPQWEPPIKILPLAGQNSAATKNSESDSSNADCADSSEDDIEVIKGLDPVKLQAFIEKKIEARRLQRYNRLVEEKPISPRKEEDRIYNQMEVRKYKENKEKIRKRKEEIRRRRESSTKANAGDTATTETAETDEAIADAVPIQDYLLSSDEEDTIKAECNNSPLIDKIVQGDKIVDELDALQCKRPLKRPLPIREKYEHKKRKMDKSKDSSKSSKRSKDGESGSSSSSSKYRKIREKFRCDIAGIIVQHLKPYRKETCFSGRIVTDDDFNHLAKKLTHFVMVKELKYCESIGQTLVVTESVKNKSREFIKKYMAKYDGVYVRPKNDPEFKEIPFL